MSETVAKSSEALAAKLDPLRPLVERLATVRDPMKKVFLSCVRASFVKAFKFVDLASIEEHDHAFFFYPALRGITEDFIVLRFLSRFPHKCREQVVKNIQFSVVHRSLKRQESFFRTFRPFQHVIPPLSTHDESALVELRSFWQTNGWPKLRYDMPPVKEIAEKSDPGILDVVYDFIYRLTSDIVHFNPQVLFRSGWGNDLAFITFDFRNMGNYYLAVSQIYGSYLLCLYLESFGRAFGLTPKEKSAVADLRKHLLDIFRWPEMVTFEEMNVSPPPPPLMTDILVRRIYNIIMTKGFISGAKEILTLRRSM